MEKVPSLKEGYIKFLQYMQNEVAVIIPAHKQADFKYYYELMSIAGPSEQMINWIIETEIRPQYNKDEGESLIHDWEKKFEMKLKKNMKDKLKLFIEFFSKSC